MSSSQPAPCDVPEFSTHVADDKTLVGLLNSSALLQRANLSEGDNVISISGIVQLRPSLLLLLEAEQSAARKVQARLSSHLCEVCVPTNEVGVDLHAKHDEFEG